MSGKLLIIGTPLGNREDISIRAIKTLFGVDILLCEDTRVTDKLLNIALELSDKIQITNVKQKLKLVRFDENVERLKTHQVIAWLNEGKQVGLVTDAGMPSVSDPGTYLVEKCYEARIQVEVIPGPSALTAAIALAGMPASQVLFLGFLPKKNSKRQRLFEDLRFKIPFGLAQGGHDLRIKPVIILYESPYRLKQTLEEIRDQLDDPFVAAMGELTKLHEKVIRGKASDVLETLPEVIKGEWVITIGMEN